MLTLLNPSALLALLGLLVPVAIHLWNRRPGREVAVGSLRWLAAGANRRLRNLKPQQLWLLLLRAALLAVLAGALAEPAWRQALPAGRGQVLLSPELLGTPALATLRPTLDSLRRRGYALRALAPGFPTLRRPGPGRADSLGLPRSGGPADDFRWARVQQAAAVFPGQPLYVVTPASLLAFQGPHPALPAQVSWHVLPTDTATAWLQAAAGQGDSLRLLLGRSRAAHTTFQLATVARPRSTGLVQVAGLPALRLTSGTAELQLRPLAEALNSAPGTGPAVPVWTRPLRVVLYATPAFAADARVLQAGLRAAATGLPVPLALSRTATPPSPATAPDWLFWLADEPLPPAWRAAVRGGGRVWQLATGPGTADTAALVAGLTEEAPVAIFRRGPAPSQPGGPAGLPLWTDGRGRPVLVRQAVGRGTYYQLSTRLNPAWSGMADSPALPARLLALLQPEPTDETAPATTALDQALARQDQRSIDPAQLITGTSPAGVAPGGPAGGPPAPGAYRLTDLRPWLVLAAGLLLLLERLLAHRRGQLNLSSPA